MGFPGIYGVMPSRMFFNVCRIIRVSALVKQRAFPGAPIALPCVPCRRPGKMSAMDRLERFYKIDRLLNERKVVPFAVFKEKLGMSRASVKRDLEYMRDRFNAPIDYD